MKKISQSNAILKYLKEGNSISSLDALNKFGCFRLSARIHDLKSQGYNINSRSITRNDKTFNEYYV